MGLAVVEGDVRKLVTVAFATVRPKSSDLPARLAQLHDEVSRWLDKYKPDAAAVEEVFVRKNARSALLLGQARGAILVPVGRRSVPVFGYPPATIKKSVAGHGRAGKTEIRRMVRFQLGLDRDPAEDSADALAVAVTHLLHAESPVVAATS